MTGWSSKVTMRGSKHVCRSLSTSVACHSQKKVWLFTVLKIASNIVKEFIRVKGKVNWMNPFNLAVVVLYFGRWVVLASDGYRMTVPKLDCKGNSSPKILQLNRPGRFYKPVRSEFWPYSPCPLFLNFCHKNRMFISVLTEVNGL
jgi:hypothetical protein